MKNLLFLLLLVLGIGTTSCAQAKSIKQAKAYYYLRKPGALMIDEKGNPIEGQRDTVITIYVEVNGKVPKWKNAWWQGHLFTVFSTTVSDDVLVIGNQLNSKQKVRMKKASGNKIIALQLQPTTTDSSQKKIGRTEVIVEGLANGKTFFYKIKKATEIASPEFM